MSVKTLEIDGKMVTGVMGETLFSVAWNNGIQIPRLCHIGGISEVGACRLCLVEIEGQKKLQASVSRLSKKGWWCTRIRRSCARTAG
jgi:bidirectional [NiFe] hydrogenase diaphorase subunit